MLPDSVAVLEPLSTVVYAVSNAIVAHAARVQANTGPAVKVWPSMANRPVQVLQSTRVESWPSPRVSV